MTISDTPRGAAPRSPGTSAESSPATGGLGTFGGVFTPSVLTILGIILFMRLGYVVGGAGLSRALILIGVANLISVLTTFSLSAIATNLRVKGGGDYYLISRTLGRRFGGSLGLVLFLAQSVSIAFYLIGFGEALSDMITGAPEYLPRLVAAAAGVALFALAWLGADWATKFQYVVMAALVLSLASFFAGGLGHWDSGNLSANWAHGGNGMSFWILFAIFFPAVTGFTQGVSMSGDLKNPGKSLPLGTFLAVGISIAVYFGATLIFAGSLAPEKLTEDYQAMRRVATFSWLVDAGVIAATLSSAMASFLGAPRILQSLSRDRIFPVLNPFARGSGPSENPRRGVLLAAGIAAVTIAAGDLNVIAPVVSMFFLISYGLLNYATYFEASTASPSFRPRFHLFHPYLSLLGALACLGVMMAIDWKASLIALAILVAIQQYLKARGGPARWADSTRSYHYKLIRTHLLALLEGEDHPRDWRPRLLVFSRESKRRERLLRFASWLDSGAGFTTAVQIVEGKGARAAQARREAEVALDRELAQLDVQAFGRVVAAPNTLGGARLFIQSYGIGPLKANTVVLNWREQRPGRIGPSGREERLYGRHLRAALSLGCNVVVLDCDRDAWNELKEVPGKNRRIDVWWLEPASGNLMLLLAYLVTRNRAWEDARIRVLAPRAAFGAKEESKKVQVGDEEDGADPLARLQALLDDDRIDGEAVIVDELTPVTLVERSQDAALTLLPFRIQAYQPTDLFGNRLDELFTHLPLAAMVIAAEDIPLDADPEEGNAGETAARRDRADDALKAASAAEDEAEKASKEADRAMEAYLEAAAGDDEEKTTSLREAMTEARKIADRAIRKAARAKVKAEAAARDAGK